MIKFGEELCTVYLNAGCKKANYNNGLERSRGAGTATNSKVSYQKDPEGHMKSVARSEASYDKDYCKWSCKQCCMVQA